MSTLAEIEAAVRRLPEAEQRVLLHHLNSRLRARPPVTNASRSQRERWMQRLDQLRARGVTGKAGAPLQEIFDDIRAERC